MTRTQIQLPDELYQQAKALATDREISLAELVRRGLERELVSLTPPGQKGGTELPVLNLGAADPVFDYPELGNEMGWMVAAETEGLPK